MGQGGGLLGRPLYRHGPSPAASPCALVGGRPSLARCSANPCLFTQFTARAGRAECEVSTSCPTPRFFNRLLRAMTLRPRPCPCTRRSTSRTTLACGSCPSSSMPIGFGERIVGSSGSRGPTPVGCAFVSSATTSPGSPSSAMSWNGIPTNSSRRATLRSRLSAASLSSCFDILRTAVCRACGQSPIPKLPAGRSAGMSWPCRRDVFVSN